MADPSVFLTVQGEGSLVEEYCSGTVRLFCEGVELNSLRWRYNGTNTLHTFLSDAQPSATPILLNNPTFHSVQLTSISSLFSGIANFSSVLSVDLEILHRNSIRSISCGDVINFESIPVDQIVLYEATLSNPKVSFFSAYYDYDILQNVLVSWKKLVSDYNLS